MDLIFQCKLNKSEWESIESPVPETEKEILSMIIKGYSDIDYKYNRNQSLFTFAKIERNESIENHLYFKFFANEISNIIKLIAPVNKNVASPIIAFHAHLTQNPIKEKPLKNIKSADKIRLDNMNANIVNNRESIIEYKFIDFAKQLMEFYSKHDSTYVFYLYTLIQLRHISVQKLNVHVMDFIDRCIDYLQRDIQLNQIIQGAYDFIEKNTNLFKYGDISLFQHQKELFSYFKSVDSSTTCGNLVLYIAPTGTGKTLSPIGLSCGYRVIFVCAARHVGMALAKSAISSGKGVAFAFGCENADDIRLHYFAAKDYTIDKRSGGIGKVNNAVGDKVEIMICDIKSYLIAMEYMLGFNDASKIIMYWDEPTISMDYDDHELHALIQHNWTENQIPNVVLSSATLPKQHELSPIIDAFKCKFESDHYQKECRVKTITSYDCNKSISVMNKSGICVCPHFLFESYRDIQKCVEHCENNKTLLRYFDLKEVVRFIGFLIDRGFVAPDDMPAQYFQGQIQRIRMNSLKIYYLHLLKSIDDQHWTTVYQYMKNTTSRRFQHCSNSSIRKTTSLQNAAKPGGALSRTHSVAAVPTVAKTVLENAVEKSIQTGGILVTTVDAHTLTDGPTIYLTEDIQRIGQFYIQQSNIPRVIFDKILEKIAQNNVIMKRIQALEKTLEDLTSKDSDKDKKMSRMGEDGAEGANGQSRRIDEDIKNLRKEIKNIALDPCYIPNTVQHQGLWVSPDKANVVKNAFIPVIDADTVKEIMELDVDDSLKILLLIGIGSFASCENSRYTEIVKRLAYEQRLFMIIASSDYIYGTNYQFCHGFIGKDLTMMTQQKIIQAMGRIGRNNIQQEYTVRFRDDDMLERLFKTTGENKEALNMCRLLV